MDPFAHENNRSDHSGVSQRFLNRVDSGLVLIQVVDLVSSKSGGEVVSGSETSVDMIGARVEEADQVEINMNVDGAKVPVTPSQPLSLLSQDFKTRPKMRMMQCRIMSLPCLTYRRLGSRVPSLTCLY
ncbi:hypothetical protein PanWU01x14_122220 [Parasponia andersonii]|uniref:Uncharacterized protein n=1 Tax=Parasponia andersonii TaxID=3476 RepID=A0A2P5CUK9_PARAD|nr:hypothetical protein PanWU01x14_122220 [Parasponia andersonii]